VNDTFAWQHAITDRCRPVNCSSVLNVAAGSRSRDLDLEVLHTALNVQYVIISIISIILLFILWVIKSNQIKSIEHYNLNR